MPSLPAPRCSALLRGNQGTLSCRWRVAGAVHSPSPLPWAETETEFSNNYSHFNRKSGWWWWWWGGGGGHIKKSVSDQNVKQVQLVWFFRRLNSGVFPFWRFHWCRSPGFLQPWAVDLGVPGTILVASKSLLGSRIHIIHQTALGYTEQFHPTSQKWREQIPIHRIYGYLHIVCVKWPPVFSGFGSSFHAPKRSGHGKPQRT